MDVSIILINYNTKDLTIDCINSVFEKTEGLEYEILLIDNKSSDGSVEAFKKINDPRLVVIPNDENEGTCRAFNKCAKIAKGKYVFWLNTDTLFINNALYELFSFMEAHPDCGICGGNLYKPDGSPNFSFRKPLFNPNRAIRELSLFKQYQLKNKNFCTKNFFNSGDTPYEAAHVCGADMMIRKSVFDEIGYFVNETFMYGDEVEFEYRMLVKTNYTSYSVPQSKIIHLEGASFKEEVHKFNEFHFFHEMLGFTRFLDIHFGKKKALQYLRAYQRMLSKRILICKILRKKHAIEGNALRKACIKSYIENYDEFLKVYREKTF